MQIFEQELKDGLSDAIAQSSSIAFELIPSLSSEETKKEVIEIWRGIFGEEALPVNFLTPKDQDKKMTRGDFALFLKETLDVLTYKILP